MLRLSRNHLFIFGVFIICFFILRVQLNYLANGIKTQGTVLNKEERDQSKLENLFIITNTYVTFIFNTKEYTFKAGTNLNLPEKVTVVFLPDKPSEARVLDFFGFFFDDLLIVFFACLLLSGIIYSFIPNDKYIILGFKSKE